VNWLFGIFPGLYETFYFRGIFQVLRVAYDYTFGWIPIPMVYVLFLVVIQVIYQFLKFEEFKKAEHLMAKVWSVIRPVLSLLGAVLFFFYFLWGFNYKQPALAQQLDLPDVQPDTTELYNEASVLLKEMTRLRSLISKDKTPLTADALPRNYENTIRLSLEEVFDQWDIPTNGRVRVRELRPSGILLRISTAGVYIPFVFEGHIDAGLHPIQYPFTMAHEMSHGYGIADEGTCNFTGVLACLNSEDPFIRYSASMSLWRYMAGNLKVGSSHLYRELMSAISPNVKRDLIAVMDQMDLYPDIMPKVRDAVYDSYLKSHGVQAGLSSYSTVVELMLSWKLKGTDKKLLQNVYEGK